MFKRRGCASRSLQSRIPSQLNREHALPQLSARDPARFALALFVAILGLSGCMMTSDRSHDRASATSRPDVIPAAQETADTANQTLQVRHESHSDDVPSPSADEELPPAPDSNSLMMASGTATLSDGFASPISTERPLTSQFLNVNGPNAIESERELGRSRLTAQSDFPNPISSPYFGSGRTAANANQRTGSTAFEQMSPLLRNRMQDSVGAGEEPQFNYPDIHSDPAKRYHELFGVDEKHDPFLFPALVNLIFEDRWLLAEQDPAKALKNQLQRRVTVDIRDPDPDLANFPNGAYTIPKGRLYIENSPLGIYGGSSNGHSPRIYQWEYLIRYGLTDNLEFRVFSNGLTDQAAHGNQPSIAGYQPLALDFKANFWEENTKYYVPAMGVELYLQTNLLGSSAFNSGTQPSINLLFDQSLPFGLSLEYNFGYTGVQNELKQIAYQFSYQWSLQREIMKDFDIFFHGFYNAAALPRLNQFQNSSMAAIPNVTVVGGGWIWTVSSRLAIFGSYNFGLTPDSPSSFALLGFAVAL